MTGQFFGDRDRPLRTPNEDIVRRWSIEPKKINTFAVRNGKAETLKNDPKEVVQLYFGFPNSTSLSDGIGMPEKLLRGFKKVFLQPGEERVIDFTVPIAGLTYYDTATKYWALTAGKYEVLVGTSSRNEKMLKGEFEVD